jgi:hypothetical protein
VPHGAVLGLEVHGAGVHASIPRDGRQLFLRSADPGADARSGGFLPALRVGRRYQQAFWQRVLDYDFYAGGQWAFLAKDHFEICMRRPGPGSATQRGSSEWSFRVKVLSPAGITVNCSIVCPCGDERELCPGDTLTVDVPPALSSEGGSTEGARGLHFTFMPYGDVQHATTVAAVRPASVSFDFSATLAGEVQATKLLPDLSSLAAGEGDEGAAERQTSRRQTWPTGGNAGVLRLPVTVALDTGTP